MSFHDMWNCQSSTLARKQEKKKKQASEVASAQPYSWAGVSSDCKCDWDLFLFTKTFDSWVLKEGMWALECTFKNTPVTMTVDYVFQID